MKTFILLENQPELGLPEGFAGSDVRYPQSLVKLFLNEFTQPGDTVLDPFAGYGTTLLAAEAMGRVAYGVECDERRVSYARSYLRSPENLIHGDSLSLSSCRLPPIDFSMTSPPYTTSGDNENPFTNYTTAGGGYAQYLNDIAMVYRQLAALMGDGARAVVEAANIKSSSGVTTLAWDIAEAISSILVFEGEVIVGWDHYGYGYDHSYCLIFRKGAGAP